MSDIATQVRELELEQLHASQRGTQPPPLLWREGGYYKSILKADQADSPLIFVASEESPDRMGDVIAIGGWKLDNFKANPVFMLSHDHSGLPIGTVPDVRAVDKQLLASVKFDAGDANAMLVKGKYERGVMRAVSVGFRALSFEERADQPGAKNPGLLFKESELLEISAVAVPAHPTALLRRAMEQRAFYSFPTKQEPKPEPVAPAAFSPEQIERLRQAIREITG